MDPKQPVINPNLVDVIHEWLGQSGLRKIWGIQRFGSGAGSGLPDGFLPLGELFLRENDITYFKIWNKSVMDCGDRKYEIITHVSDPDFFEKLRKMLDYRESSNTIICRCPQCEGVKL